jgi:hypothetical protein
LAGVALSVAIARAAAAQAHSNTARALAPRERLPFGPNRTTALPCPWRRRDSNYPSDGPEKRTRTWLTMQVKSLTKCRKTQCE